MIKRISVISLVILCASGATSAWDRTELMTIKRGSGTEEISYSPAGTVGGPGTFEYPAEGPHMAVVDKAENIIIISAQNRQLKGFDSQGSLMFDFSMGKPGYKFAFYDESPKIIYVDSLMRIHLQSDFGKHYIPVISYDGELLEKIRPFQQDPNVPIENMNWAPDGTLFLYNRTYGWVTYSKGISRPGGTKGFKASNGSYYAAGKKTAESLVFNRYENPDSKGVAESKVLTEVPIDVDTLMGAALINGGDGNSLYVILATDGYSSYRIWQFDLDYNVIDSLTLANEETYGDLRISPYVRRDGNIYEFLFREDGLQVIKWTK